MSCKSTPYKNLFDTYVKDGFFGGMDYSFFEPINSEIRGRIVATSGFVVNKDWNEILRFQSPKHSFHFRVFDHIRVIEEVLTGMFQTDNKEFNMILPEFMKHFMMNNIWVIYSEEFKVYELKLATKLARENHQDPYDVIENACPNSNFRLLRRVSDDKGSYRWDAVLSGVQNVKVEEFLPVVEGEQVTPLKFTFNKGFFFIRLFHIFMQYEAQMQMYFKLFQALHKVGDITGEDLTAVNSKKAQFESAQVFTHSVMSESENNVTVQNNELVQNMPQLTESYDNIHALLNDQLGRLGLAGDDSTKAERITTGENFRALQPNMSFQQAIQHSLDNVSERIKIHFKQAVSFTNELKPNEQGIPMSGQENKQKENDFN